MIFFAKPLKRLAYRRRRGTLVNWDLSLNGWLRFEALTAAVPGRTIEYVTRRFNRL